MYFDCVRMSLEQTYSISACSKRTVVQGFVHRLILCGGVSACDGVILALFYSACGRVLCIVFVSSHTLNIVVKYSRTVIATAPVMDFNGGKGKSIIMVVTDGEAIPDSHM